LWRDILKISIDEAILASFVNGEQLRNIQYNLNEIADKIGYPQEDMISDLHKDHRKVFAKILKDIDYREDKPVTVLIEEKMDGPIITAGHEYIVEFLMTPKTGIYLKMTHKLKTSDRLKQARPDIWGDEDIIRFHYEFGSKTKPPNYERLLENVKEEDWDEKIDKIFWRMGREGEEHGFTFKDIKIYSDPKLRFRGAEKVTGQEGEERSNWWS